MQAGLRLMLSQLTDEEFWELIHGIGISVQIRELMNGPNGFDAEEMLERLDLHNNQLELALNGAFEFTVKHMGTIKVLQDEKDFFDMDEDDTENETEEAGDEGSDVPEEVNYNIFDKEPEDNEAVVISNPRELTEEEKHELENDDNDYQYNTPPGCRPAIIPVNTNIFADEMKKVYENHQEKIKKEAEVEGNEKKDSSTIEFIDL